MGDEFNMLEYRKTMFLLRTCMPYREDFAWIMDKGDRIRLSKMKDTHVFNTLKMIWNNKVDIDYSFGEFKAYYFGASHPDEYLIEAFGHLFSYADKHYPNTLGLGNLLSSIKHQRKEMFKEIQKIPYEDLPLYLGHGEKNNLREYARLSLSLGHSLVM